MTEQNLENPKEIVHLLNSGHPAKTSAGVGKALLNLTSEISKASVESGKLTRVLNRVTLAGVIVTVLALIIAGLNLLFVYKLQESRKKCWSYSQGWEKNGFSSFDDAYKSCLRELGLSD